MTSRLEDIHQIVEAVPPDVSVAVVAAMFESDREITLIPVTLDDAPIGAIYRSDFMALILSAPSKEAVYGLTATRIMDRDPVCAEAHLNIGYFGHQCLTGALDAKAFTHGAMLTREGAYCSVVDSGKLAKGLATLSTFQTQFIQKQRSRISEQASQHATEKRQQRSQMAMLAHEIRTPLTGLLGVADLLCDAGLPSKSAKLAQTISQSGQSLQRLLADMIDFGALETGQLSISTETIDLQQFAKEAKTLWQSHKWARGLTFDVRLTPKAVTRVESDPVRLRQIAYNLISNALKFTNQGSVIVTIDTSPAGSDGNTVIIQVADTGPGISESERDRVFQSWHQVDQSDPSTPQGAGLGLSISRSLAERMGGSIRITGNPGGGTIFTASIKADTKGPKLAIDRTADATAIPAGNFELGSILVADDHGLSRYVIEQGLASAGWQLDMVQNGHQALRRARAKTYQAILLDIHMPELGGDEVLTALRKSSGPNALTPVLAMSADVSRGQKQRCLELGFKGFVEKPIRPRQLVTDLSDVILKSREPSVDRVMKRYG